MRINLDLVFADAKAGLAEDIGSGDVTAALLSPTLKVQAEIISRQPMLVAGIAWVNAVFSIVNSDINLKWTVKDGDWLDEPSSLCQITGLGRDILTAERTALNFLQTLSATATQTSYYVAKIKNTNTRLLDTRKTLPMLRYGQKYAVLCGGGHNHRMGLYDAFLIKENHILACGSIAKAVERARILSADLLLEVEVESIDEFKEVLNVSLDMPIDRILLDNFTLAMLREAVVLNKSRCVLEASGGINLSNISEVAETGVNFISVGAITKSVCAIDLSLLIKTIV